MAVTEDLAGEVGDVGLRGQVGGVDCCGAPWGEGFDGLLGGRVAGVSLGDVCQLGRDLRFILHIRGHNFVCGYVCTCA
jgi:hypothetical protein